MVMTNGTNELAAPPASGESRQLGPWKGIRHDNTESDKRLCLAKVADLGDLQLQHRRRAITTARPWLLHSKLAVATGVGGGWYTVAQMNRVGGAAPPSPSQSRAVTCVVINCMV
jgi:hypothetical protein